MLNYPKIVQSSKITPYHKPLTSISPNKQPYSHLDVKQLPGNKVKGNCKNVQPNYMAPLKYTEFLQPKNFVVNRDPHKNRIRSDVFIKRLSQHSKISPTSVSRLDPLSIKTMALKLNAQQKTIFQKPYILSRRDPYKNKIRTDVQFYCKKPYNNCYQINRSNSESRQTIYNCTNETQLTKRANSN